MGIEYGLAGKVAIVSGAASGIGSETARQLVEEGVNVVGFDIDEQRLVELTTRLSSIGEFRPFVGDAREADDHERCVNFAATEFGGLDLAFNNAGAVGPRGDIGDYDASDDFASYKACIDLNLNSVFFALRFQIPAMLERGGGSIVNMSSIMGLVGAPMGAPYTAAKHGVSGLTKVAGSTYASRRIRVNSVHPGYTETPILNAFTPKILEDLVSKHPIGRLGLSSEIANVVLFLLSDRASFMTGAQVVVDGGFTSV